MTFQPHLFILSAPSGAGKTTISKSALAKLDNLIESVSYTTREPREGEVEGIDYFFISKDEFKKKRDNNEMLEWAEIYGNFYGTSRGFVEEVIKKGKNVLLVIDIQGARNISALKYPLSIFIFIEPPSMEILKQRLQERGTEDAESLERRISSAELEMSFADQFDYRILNDDFDTCVDNFVEIINEHSL